MERIKSGQKINFLGIKKTTFLISGVFILLGIVSLVVKGGPVLGIDFAGGTLVQVKFDNTVKIKEIRGALKSIDMESADIQQFGSSTDFLIRMEGSSNKLEDIGSGIEETFKKKLSDYKIVIERIETVGPKVGSDLRQQALFALFYTILFIAVYISGRFEHKWESSGVMATGLIICMQILLSLFPGLSITILIILALAVTLGFCVWLDLKYALAAIIALMHDVMLTVGAFSLTNKEFSLPVIAAVLTIIGYSLNDTIVVFDRIRENLKIKQKSGLFEVINISINQSLSRTLLTSITTLLMVLSLFILGGEVIHDFSFALLIGIVVGTYSSIFIASPILLAWDKKVSH